MDAPSDGRMRDEAHLRRLWGILRRNPLLAFGVPAVVVVATVVAVLLMTPIYRAETSVRLEDERPQIGLMDALQRLGPIAGGGGEVETEMEVLRSRTLAEQVVDSLNLQLVPEEPARVRRRTIFARHDVPRDAIEAEYRLERESDGRFRVEAEYLPGSADPLLPWSGRVTERLGTFAVGRPIELLGATVVLAPGAAEHESIVFTIRSFAEAVKAFRDEKSVSRPNREARIVVVGYEHPDPEVVRDAMNVMAAAFIERRRDVKKSQERSTVRFLTAQIDTLQGQLAAAEERLRTFRREANAIAPEAEAEAEIQRLAEMQGERDVAMAEREALAALMREVEAAAPAPPGEPSPYRELIGFPAILQNAAASELLGMLFQLETRRDSLLVQRTAEDPEVGTLTRRIDGVERQLHRMASTYLDGLTDQVASLDATLVGYRSRIEEIPDKDITFARLKREVEVLGELYGALQTRLKEGEVAVAVEDVSVRVVDPAILPQRPVRPQKMISLLLALVLGLVVGVGSAWTREYLDTALHTRAQLHAAAELPVLGLIPRIGAAHGDGGRLSVLGRRARTADGRSAAAHLIATRAPRSPFAEAYRSLRTNITFSRPERPPAALVFTSPQPGDGKTTTVTNLALTLGRQDRRVLLVDADLRRGSLHTLFGTPREPGLSQVLLGRVSVADAARRVAPGDGVAIDLLPTGTLPPDPGELIGSERMHTLLEELRGEYDAILLDAPPLNVVTDAALLGTNADGVVIVARAGVTDRAVLEQVIEQLRHVRAPVLGTVLNDVDYRRQQGYDAVYEYHGDAGADHRSG